VLHEAEGVNVLLARVIAGRNTDASRLFGNLVFQKPMSSERDAVDLVTSVGWARKLTHGVSLGVEAVGEDLEGFWDPQEAEGGARLLADPSLHISPSKGRWQLTATAVRSFTRPRPVEPAPLEPAPRCAIFLLTQDGPATRSGCRSRSVWSRINKDSYATLRALRLLPTHPADESATLM
jgi:hypothetical protein